MKAIVLTAAALLVGHSLSAVDLSVNTLTDFLSDIKATIAARDQDGDQLLDKAELGDQAWMLVFLDKDRDGRLTEAELRRGVGRLSRNLFPSRAHEPSKELAPPLELAPASQRGPRVVRGVDYRIGRLIPDAELTTLDGQSQRLSAVAGEKGTMIAVLSTSCPVSQKYLPELARLERASAAQGVKLVALVAPGEDDYAALKATGLAAPLRRDPSGALFRALGATHTTDVFLLDAARTLVYRGAIDDQYGQGYSLDAPRERFALPALEAMLQDRRPLMTATVAPGCELELPPTHVPTPSPITWHNRISRLVQMNCVHCHREGGVGPFPFETYAQFVKKGNTVRRVVSEEVMPPWFVRKSERGAHSPWLNDSSLTAEDQSDLLAWLEAGQPEGDPKEAARPLSWPEGWTIGQPDQVVQIPRPVEVKAEGTMPYQSIMVDPKLTEDRWVSGWEIRPTAPNVVHHILVYIYQPGDLSSPGTEERRGQLASYVPGSTAARYPEGFAKFLPKGAMLRFEIHYTPNGKVTHDQTMLGLKFAKAEPTHVVEVAGIANVQIAIPPNAASHPEAALMKMPPNIHLLSFEPHMHVRGKAMRFELILPSGEVRTLLDWPRYDFNWQIATRYAQPPAIPVGSSIRVTGWFDNSAANRANPNPNATVHWGSQTDDEMMIGYVEYYRERKP